MTSIPRPSTTELPFAVASWVGGGGRGWETAGVGAGKCGSTGSGGRGATGRRRRHRLFFDDLFRRAGPIFLRWLFSVSLPRGSGRKHGPFRQRLGDQGNQRVGHERLRNRGDDVRIFPRRGGHFRNVTRHHHHRNPRRRFVFQQPFADLIAAQIGQAVIEQHQIGKNYLGAPDTFTSRERRCDLQIRIGRGQRVFHEDQQHLGIVDDDDFLSGLPRLLRWLGNGR